jgi:hypothetical protein
MATLTDVDKLHPDILQEFRRTKRSNSIPEDVQQYIIQIDIAFDILKTNGSIRDAARELVERMNSDELTFATARRRIYDAINYFHINSTVRNEAWDNYYADRFEELSKQAYTEKDYTEARRCLERAHTLRTKRDENAINPEDMKIKDWLINPDISPERLGLKEYNLRRLWLDSQTFIDDLKLDSEHKQGLLKETAEVIDVDYEDV